MEDYIKNNFNKKLPLPNIFETSWKDYLGDCDYIQFNNLNHFKHTVSKLAQKQDTKCDISYSDAIDMLIKGESNFPKSEQDSIRNLVRSNLYKRGLITQEIYENFKYTSDGTNLGVDVGKYCAGDSECVLSPSKQYIDFFYELYIDISYPYNVTNDTVRANVAKLLATIEELERQHIYIKINTVLSVSEVSTEGDNFFSSIPIFSHKDFKSVELMSSVINDRLLRKFYFAVLENLYGKNLDYGYGYPKTMSNTINIGGTIDEISLFTDIQKNVGAL